jgi:hypothetical protein
MLTTWSAPGEPSFCWSFAADSAIHWSETRVVHPQEQRTRQEPRGLFGTESGVVISASVALHS